MRLSILFAIFASLSIFVVFQGQNAYATTFTLTDQASCEAAPFSGTWVVGGNGPVCTVSTFTVNSGDIIVINSGITLSNTGTFNNFGNITNNGTLFSSTSGTFTNNGTVTNNGAIGNDGNFINNVTITNNSTTGNFCNIINDGGTITNNGAINSITNNICVIVNHGIINNFGTIDNIGTYNTGGTINNFGTFTNIDGTITNYLGGTINNNGIINNNKGIIDNNGIIINNSGGTITNNNFGSIINDGGTITNLGTITNFGSIFNNSGTINNNGTISNSGILTSNGTITNNSSGTITNNSSGTITNTGSINNICPGMFNQNGIFSGNPINNSCTTDDADPAVLGTITAPVNPIQINTQFTASASFTDDSDDTHTASWNWGDNTTSAGIVTESGGSGSVQNTHTYTSPGVYTITLTVNNSAGTASTIQFQYVVAYDPNGGFVTGSGWINSPAGAYTSDASFTGKATFGFNSKYQHGATVPTGNTEFHFQVANLNFHSTNYNWLVISGAKAQYTGTGTINGAGSYHFMLTAIDGEINGGGGIDKLRMKITGSNDNIVYDNHLNAPDGSDPTTALGGGDILIHNS